MMASAPWFQDASPLAGIQGDHSVGYAAQNVISVVPVERDRRRSLLGTAAGSPVSGAARRLSMPRPLPADGFDEGHPPRGEKVPWGGGDEGRDADGCGRAKREETGVAQDFRGGVNLGSVSGSCGWTDSGNLGSFGNISASRLRSRRPAAPSPQARRSPAGRGPSDPGPLGRVYRSVSGPSSMTLARSRARKRPQVVEKNVMTAADRAWTWWLLRSDGFAAISQWRRLALPRPGVLATRAAASRNSRLDRRDQPAQVVLSR